MFKSKESMKQKGYLSNIKHFALTLAVIALGGILTAPFLAMAQSPQEKINELDAQINAAEGEIARLQSQASTLQNQLDILAAEKNAIQKKIDRNESTRQKLEEEIRITEENIAKQQRVLGDTLGDLYINNSVTHIEMLASSRSIGDYIDQQSYQSSIRDGLQEAIETIKQLRQKLDNDKKEILAVLEKQKIQRNELAHKEEEQNRLLAATRGKESRFKEHVGELQAQRKKAEEALIASLTSGSYRVAPAGYVSVGQVIGTVGSTGLSTGPHLHLEARDQGRHINPASYIQQDPVTPVVITQAYGNYDPELYTYGSHPGVDYGAVSGTPIRSVSSGMMYRGWGVVGEAYGCAAVVEVGSGIVLIYGHMEAKNC